VPSGADERGEQLVARMVPIGGRYGWRFTRVHTGGQRYGADPLVTFHAYARRAPVEPLGPEVARVLAHALLDAADAGVGLTLGLVDGDGTPSDASPLLTAPPELSPRVTRAVTRELRKALAASGLSADARLFAEMVQTARDHARQHRQASVLEWTDARVRALQAWRPVEDSPTDHEFAARVSVEHLQRLLGEGDGDQ
jgi:hypothetical protein